MSRKRRIQKSNIILTAFLLALLLSLGYLKLSWPAFSPFEEGPSEQDNTKDTEVNNSNGDEQKEEELEAPPPPRIETVNLLATGDLMFHDSQLEQALNKDTGEYDFYPSFEVIAPFIQSADFAVANLETTLAGREQQGYSSFPQFNTPESLAGNLKEAGFDLLSTANNHSLDRRELGVYKTIEHLESVGLAFTGTSRSKRERDTPVIKEINGINIAFLAYTYGTNGIPIPEGKGFLVNLIDEDLIEADIQQARSFGADMVVVFMHWGHEYHTSPSAEQKELARKLVAMGADIILGSHPHVIQPMEFIRLEEEDGNVKEGFVIYSLGNFISNQHLLPPYIPTEKVEFGMLLQIKIEKNFATETYIEDVSYLPTWVHRGWRHRVLPVNRIINEEDHGLPLGRTEFENVRRVWAAIEDEITPIEAVTFLSHKF
ncbi:MAG: CapA family protein [Dethiobacteria bacterium]